MNWTSWFLQYETSISWNNGDNSSNHIISSSYKMVILLKSSKSLKALTLNFITVTILTAFWVLRLLVFRSRILLVDALVLWSPRRSISLLLMMIALYVSFFSLSFYYLYVNVFHLSFILCLTLFWFIPKLLRLMVVNLTKLQWRCDFVKALQVWYYYACARIMVTDYDFSKAIIWSFCKITVLFILAVIMSN